MPADTPSPSNKIPWIVASAGVGALAIWGLESAGAHPQVYGFVATAASGIVALTPEFLERRKKTTSQKVQELVQGDIYEHPVVVVAYLVLALQLFQRVLGGLVGLAIAAGLSGTNIAQDEVAEVVAATSPIVVFVLVLPMAFYFAQLATYRLASNAKLWIGVALAISSAINVLVIRLAQDYLGQDLSLIGLLASGVVEFLLLCVPAYFGYRRAERRRRVFVLSRLVPQLSASEQHELIELVRTLPRGDDQAVAEPVTAAGQP